MSEIMNPVVPQRDVTDRPPVAPDMESGNLDTTGAGITPPAAAPPIPAGTQVNQDPNAVPGSVEPHHGLLANIFQDLAGGKKTTWRQTENGPVAVKENLKPGEMAQSILSAALVGLAGGLKTHGGPGGNKGQAFAAGFESEEAQKEKQETEKKEQAQKQFQNQNVADELTLRKASNARDQQRSIDEHQEASMRMHQMAENLKEGDIRNAQEHLEFLEGQADKYNVLLAAGVKPLVGSDGKPVPEFDNNADLVAWLHTGDNSKLAIQQGKYNTVIATDPMTGKIQILQKPKGWDDAQWVGVKVDAKGQPIKDKDGNMIADGTFKGANGKIEVPAGPMTPHQLYDSQTRLLDLQSKILSREEMLERIKSTRRENAKNAALDLANKHLEQTEGDLDALDPKTHRPILTMADRNLLQQQVKAGTELAGYINSTRKELDRMDPNSQDYADAVSSLKQAEQDYAGFQYRQLLLSRTPNPADVLSKRLREENTDAKGQYHEDEALKAVEGITGLNSGVKQSIRQKLSAQPAPVSPEMIDKAAAQISKVPVDQQEAWINHQPINNADKETLRQKIKANSPNSEANALKEVSPDLTVIRTADGQLTSIANIGANNYVANNPGSKILGQGTKGVSNTPEQKPDYSNSME
jgi:hypothetical protein